MEKVIRMDEKKGGGGGRKGVVRTIVNVKSAMSCPLGLGSPKRLMKWRVVRRAGEVIDHRRTGSARFTSAV